MLNESSSSERFLRPRASGRHAVTYQEVDNTIALLHIEARKHVALFNPVFRSGEQLVQSFMGAGRAARLDLKWNYVSPGIFNQEINLSPLAFM